MLEYYCIICNERAYYGTSSISKLPTEVELERKLQQSHLEMFFQQLERYLDDIPLGRDKASQSQEWQTRRILPFQQIPSAGIGSCDRCCKLVESFCDLYHQMKSTELLLNWKLQTLGNLMNDKAIAPTGKKNVGLYSLSLEALDENHMFLDFKRELVQKCRRKFQNTFPRVSIKDIGKDKNVLGWNRDLGSSDDEVNPGLTTVTIKKSCSLVDDNSVLRDLSDDDSAIEDNEILKGKLRTPVPTKIPKKIPRSLLNQETGKYQCGACEKGFKNMAGYQNHYQSVHLKIRFECPICGKGFTRQGSYKRHHSTAHLNGANHCNGCNQQFTDKRKFKAHQRLCCGQEWHYRTRGVTAAIPEMLAHCSEDNLEEVITGNENPSVPDVILSKTDIKIENPPSSPAYSNSEEANANGFPSCNNSQSEEINEAIPKVSKCAGSKTSKGIPPSSINPETGKNQCSVCFKEFKYITDYRIHYRSIHLRIRYPCTICGKVFSLQNSYRKHHRIVHLGVGFQCKQCNRQFKEKRNLAAHQRLRCKKQPALKFVDSVHDPVTGRHTCSLCGKQFMSVPNYRTHYRSFHLGLRFRCPICSKLFAQRYALKLHQHCKHAGSTEGPVPKALLKRHICEHCGRRFRVKSHLQTHLKSIHLNLKGHICDHCGKRFNLFPNLQKHIKIAHLKVRDHVCDMCGKAFGMNFNLQMHIKSVHLKLREHICDICGKGYTNPKILRNHVMSVHQKFRRYECDLCKMKCSDKRRLIVHRRKHHQEENRDGNQPIAPDQL